MSVVHAGEVEPRAFNLLLGGFGAVVGGECVAERGTGLGIHGRRRGLGTGGLEQPGQRGKKGKKTGCHNRAIPEDGGGG